MTTRDHLNVRRRVLFVIGTMGGGGAERQVIEILQRLDRSRFEPMLYLAMKQGELLGDVPPDVPIIAFWDGSPESWTRRLFRWMKLTRIVRYVHLARVLHLQNIDVIYDRTYLATLDAAGGCLIRPTPRISCCVVDPQPELELHARVSKAISWNFARRAYSTASVVLANSKGLQQRVIDYFHLKPEHVQVFYNLLTTPEEENPGHPDRTSQFCVVTAGRFHAQKGQRYLLEALDELVHQQGRSIQLVLLGQGELEAELREIVRTRRLDSHVQFAGFVKNPRPWFRSADLFVLPSLYEGMPNALIEAVAVGTPVVSTDCPSGPREILDDGRCGELVPPSDSKALARAIADAMDHPEQWRARAEIARERVKRLFDPGLGIRRLETLLDQVAGERHSRP